MATSKAYKVPASDTLNLEKLYADLDKYAAPSGPAGQDRTLGQAVVDTGLSFGSGALGATKAVSDLFGANNPVSSVLQDGSEYLQDQKSDQSKATRKASQQRLEEADLNGDWMDVAGAVAQMVWDQPAEMIAEGLGSFVPMGVVGKLASTAKLAGAAKSAGMTKAQFFQSEAGRLALKDAADVAFKANIGMGAGMGVGAVKGAQYEQTLKEAKKQGIPEDEAIALADAAQAYGGPGTMQQFLGGGLGALAAATGPIESVIAGRLASKAVPTVRGGIAKGFLTEGGTEGLQGGQEAYAGNDAAIDAGVMSESDRYRGVLGQSMLEGSIGGLIGGGAGAVDAVGNRAAYQEFEALKALPPDPLQAVRDKAADGGVLSKAAVAANPVEDPLRARIDALKADGPTILDGLRKSNNPATAQDFVDTLNQAGDPRTPPDRRAAMVDQMEQYAEFARAGVVPGTVFSKETGLTEPSSPSGEDATFEYSPFDGPAIPGQPLLTDPNVIDVGGEWVDGGPEDPTGPTAPGGTPEQTTETQPADQVFTEAQAPAVDIPAGEAPAVIRKRKAQFDALAQQGFETVEKTPDGFRMVNTKTGQFFPLTSPAEVALARNSISTAINVAANKAATSPLNELKEPTEAQKKAGNYKKGEPFALNGFSVTIENPAGSVRKGVDPDGKAWESPIVHHYGDLNGVIGLDGDKMDVFVGPSPWNQNVFVVDQINPKTGKLDEHKVMMGFESAEDAVNGYLANYEPGWKGLGNLTQMSLDEFRQWSKSDGIKKAASTSGLGRVYPPPKGDTNDAGTNQASNRGQDQGVGANRPEGSGGAGADILYSEGRGPYQGQGDAGGVGDRQPAPDARTAQLLEELNLGEKSRGRDSFSEPAVGPVADAANAFLDALAKVTGRRGFAVKNTGKNSFDGVTVGDTFIVNVDSPVMPIPSTIAHEFKHTTEDSPGLKKLYDRMWDLIPADVKADYANRYLAKTPSGKGMSFDSLTDAQVEQLKSEITADFMGKRFTDKAWLQRLGKEKPALFAEFVRDWVKLLDSLISELKQAMGLGNRNKDVDLLMRNHLKELQAMKDIAIEVAAEWAVQNPTQAWKGGANDAARQGVDASMKYSHRVGPNHPLVIDDYVLPDAGIFADQQSPDIVNLPPLRFARNPDRDGAPVRIRIGNHGQDINPVSGRPFGQFGLKHRIENAAKDEARRLASAFEKGNGWSELEAAARDIASAVISAKTAYQTEFDGQIELVGPDMRGVVLTRRTDSVTGQRFWDAVTVIPRTKEWLARNRKNPIPVYGIAFNGLDAQQSSGIADGVLSKLRAPSPTHSESGGLTLDADRNIVNGEAPKTYTSVVEKKPRVLPRDANGKIILKRPAGKLDQDPGRADGQFSDREQGVLGEAGAQRLDVLQPSELRNSGGRRAGDGEAGGQAGRDAGYGRPDAQAESRGRDQPEKARRGFYGQPREGSVEVTGYHFSQQPRDTLISDFYGTGLKGAERERLMGRENSDIRPRIFFYVSRGNEIRPESGVGGVIHKLTMSNLYDVTADDLDIVASTRGKGLSEADRSSAWERAVMQAGFDGYVVKDPIQPQWYAVLVGKHTVQPSLDPVQVAEAAERSKPKSKTRREGNELVTTPEQSAVVPLLNVKPKVLEVAPSFRFQYGEVRVLESEAPLANAVIADAGVKFQFSDRVPAKNSNAKQVMENLLSDNYKELAGVDVAVEYTTDSGKTAKLTVDAKAMLEQIEKRKQALEMVKECLL